MGAEERDDSATMRIPSNLGRKEVYRMFVVGQEVRVVKVNPHLGGRLDRLVGQKGRISKKSIVSDNLTVFRVVLPDDKVDPSMVEHFTEEEIEPVS